MRQPALAIIAGASGALGPALITRFNAAGYQVAAIARRLPQEPAEAQWYTCDLTDEVAAGATFAQIQAEHGAPSVVVYNAHKFLVTPFEEISARQFEDVWRTDTFGAFVTAQCTLPAMTDKGGTLIFSGATASVRGGAKFSAFASAKFALRGLSQSLAREFGPKGVHVAHVLLDGIIKGGHAQKLYNISEERSIAPEAIAEAYLTLVDQPRSAWTQELDLRPFNENF